jgi:ATP-dependent helicase Lhr and Lhr-like helicase
VHSAADLGRLDPAVIAQVRDEAWPEIGHADELHDALLVHAFLTEGEVAEAGGQAHATALSGQRRMAWLATGSGQRLAVAAERLHEFQAVFPGAPLEPRIQPTSRERPDTGEALREILRGRLELLGPVSAAALGESLALPEATVLQGLLRLEAEGAGMRGGFTSPAADEWCDRRLLARIHRRTRDKRRAEAQPVPPAQFMRFLFRWHQLAAADAAGADVAQDERREGEDGLLAVLRQLEGIAVPVAAWEDEVLAVRVRGYEPAMLDKLCATGRVAWWRPTAGAAAADGAVADGKPRTGPIRGTPVLLVERDALPHWQQAWSTDAPVTAAEPDSENALTGRAQRVLQALRDHGASFFADLQHDAHLLGTELENALAELVAQGLVSCDSFAGLRALVMPADKRNKLRRRAPGRDPAMDDAGRWTLTRRPRAQPAPAAALADPHVEHIVRVLLRRYGVVFRRLLEREDGLPPWRELLYVLRRLEARDEVRGGRFVSGFSGEQFALPEAAAALRRMTRGAEPGGDQPPEHVAISAVDPLNLAGLITPGDKVPRLPGNRLLFDRGVPVAVQSGGEVRYLAPTDAPAQWTLKHLLIRKQRPGSVLPSPAQPQ